jgi:hypothetical protein
VGKAPARIVASGSTPWAFAYLRIHRHLTFSHLTIQHRMRPSSPHALRLWMLKRSPELILRAHRLECIRWNRAESIPELVLRSSQRSKSAVCARYSTSGSLGYYETARMPGHFMFRRIQQVSECPLLIIVHPKPLVTSARAHAFLRKVVHMRD